MKKKLIIALGSVSIIILIVAVVGLNIVKKEQLNKNTVISNAVKKTLNNNVEAFNKKDLDLYLDTVFLDSSVIEETKKNVKEGFKTNLALSLDQFTLDNVEDDHHCTVNVVQTLQNKDDKSKVKIRAKMFFQYLDDQKKWVLYKTEAA